MPAPIIVLQSQNPERLAGWQLRCCATVEAWAKRRGYHYRRCGDELFDRLPASLRARHGSQPVVLSDLARLLWLREVLDEGFEHAIWCDADLLLFEDFDPLTEGDRFGRECWVQGGAGRPRSYRKIHNAWLQFSRGSPALAFYIDRASALLTSAPSPVVPQFIGPKLLTAWHNIAPFAVEERVGMLSPLAMLDLLGELPARAGALRALLRGHAAPLCGLNLSASLEGREWDGVHAGTASYARVIEGLTEGDLAERLAAA